MAVHATGTRFCDIRLLKLLLVVLMVQGVCTQWSSGVSSYQLAAFDNPVKPELTVTTRLDHFTVHSDTGDVYIGAINFLYRLGDDLMQVTNFSTATCFEETCLNYNKVLALQDGRLVTCGSDDSGSCQSRNEMGLEQDNRATDSPNREFVVGYGDKSTEGVIASGPDPSRGYIYVAVSYSVNYQNIPALSRRLLVDSNGFMYSDTENDAVGFSSDYTSSPFDINYVGAFSLDEFTYFAIQENEERIGFPGQFDRRPKISRVCQDSESLHSYTEILLQCQVSSSNRFELLQATYVGSAGPHLTDSLALMDEEQVLYAVFVNEQETDSALCVYKMSDIVVGFADTVEGCLQGPSPASYRADHLQGDECRGSTVNPNNYLCDARAEFKYATGITPVTATPVVVLPGHTATSIIATTDLNHTMAFIGTDSGKLLKVHVERRSFARLYEVVDIDGNAVQRDALITEQQELFVLTEQKLVKMRVENCNQYTTCETCIGTEEGMDGDPYCGWCTLERKCTRFEACPMQSVSTRWLAYNDAQCAEISSVSPKDSLPITVTSRMVLRHICFHVQEVTWKVTLTVERLPDLLSGKNYSCGFGEDYRTGAEVTADNMLRCTTPPANKIPAITSEDYVAVVLNVKSSETAVDFVDTDFYFFECSTHTSCVSCVGSRWACDWCVFDNRCTHDSSTCTVQNEIIVTGENNLLSSMQGPDGCPQIEQQSGEILIPNDASMQITFFTANLPPTDLISEYECRLHVDGALQSSNAERSNDDITCILRKYTYTETVQELNVSLSLMWTDNGGATHLLDDRYHFTVTLYKCQALRPDCSRCVSEETTRAELGCVWCEGTCSVSNSEVCTTSSRVVTPDDDLNCEDPVILSVYPEFGPLEGNTTVTLTGTDLGRRYEDIGNIIIGSLTCNTRVEGYMTGSSVTCTTVQNNGEEGLPIHLEVTGKNGSIQTSNNNQKFGYKDPVVGDFTPKKGPMSGGTKVIVTGQNLNSGRYIRVLLGSMVCTTNREEVTDKSLVCYTTAAAIGPYNVSVEFDGALRSSFMAYKYKEDPTVLSINPTTSVAAGGRELTVNGTGFELIQQPQMLVTTADEEENIGNCSVTDDTIMLCISPTINLVLPGIRSRRAPGDSSLNVSTGFIMDGVTALRTWCTEGEDCSSLEYFDDPIYNPFSDIFEKESVNLQISGKGLDLAISNEEVTVHVGNAMCTGVTVGSTSLICTLPDEVPMVGDYLGGNTSMNLPVVTVLHGKTLSFSIGYIRYPGIDIKVLIACLVSGLVVLIMVFVTFYLYRMRKRAEEKVEWYLDHSEKIHEELAGDMKEAFAQLQTNVTDLTSDLQGIGMPFVSYRDYATNMLFLALDTKPQTADPEYPEEHVELAMKKFCDVLNNKTFLLTFLMTLDDQSTSKLPIRDKCAIASLLTVVMVCQDNLAYLTDILFTLMSKLVQTELDAGRPKQLFRRTETILEKLLSNWITLCLYDSLKDHTANPLFILYRAIKCHCEHGPVDVVTGKANFTLSNENLLTEDIEYMEMTLLAVVNDSSGETKEVNVLDIDSISQVKEKILDAIYRNQKYSKRPSAQEVALEIRSGKAGRIVLRDFDNTNATLDGWKRTNTLRSYHVSNRSTVSLITLSGKSSTPQNMYSLDTAPESETTYVNYGFNGKPKNDPASKQRSNRYTVVEIDDREPANVWHLVKVEDGDEDLGDQRKKKGHNHRKSMLPTGRPKKRFREIYFPRLISTKGTIQEYIDKMFTAILDANTAPKTVKYLFDFFDSQAIRHDLGDTDAIKIWKGNSLSLRFWSNVIRHTDFIFDIRPSRAVEASLGVIAQAFHDAHNPSDQKLGKDSDMNKLLFNKDLPKIGERVDEYYEGISNQTRVSSSHLNQELSQISENFTGLFSKLSTLLQLWGHVKEFNPKIVEALEENEDASSDHLPYKLVEIETTLANKDCDADDAV